MMKKEETGKCVRKNGGGAVCTAPFLQRQTCCVLSGRFVRMPASGGLVRQIKQCRERIGYGTSHQGQDTGRSGCDISAIYVIAGTRRRLGVLGGIMPPNKMRLYHKCVSCHLFEMCFWYRRTGFQEKSIQWISAKYPSCPENIP